MITGTDLAALGASELKNTTMSGKEKRRPPCRGTENEATAIATVSTIIEIGHQTAIACLHSGCISGANVFTSPYG